MITDVQAQDLANELGVNLDRIPFAEWRHGVEYELEHTTDPREAARIALDHLNELPDYYSRLALAESRAWTMNLTLKTQWIRVADVILIGPLMVAGGVALSRTNKPLLGILLGALGIGTILFNGRNWWLVHQARRLNHG